MRRHVTRAMIAGVVLLGLGASGLVCQRVSARGRYAVPYSTYGAGPDGTKALYVYAEEAGLSPRRWVQDLSGLPEGALLVAIGGCEQAPNRRLSRYEIATVRDWIDEGGVLLVAGAHDYLWDDAAVALDPPPGCSPAEGLLREIARAERGEEGEDEEGEDPAATDPAALLEALLEEPEEVPPVWARGEGVLAGLGPIPLASPGSIRAPRSHEIILAEGKREAPLGAVVRQGEGAIVVLSSSSPLTNRDLAKADGGVVFARLVRELAPSGPVLFDEYHLGVGERRSLGRYVRDVGGAPFVLQVLVIVAFALFAFGLRFGRPVLSRPPVPGGTASYVEGVGDLYARTGDASAALSLVAAHGIADVAEHHHLTSISAERLASVLAERGREDAAGAVTRLVELSELAEVKSRQLAERVREVDDLVARAKGAEG